MRQKGFATIFALCIILAVAIVVKGIREAEMNHAYETADFQAEFELQNVADSGIYEAAEMIRLDEELLPANPWAWSNSQRKEYQIKLINRPIKFFDGYLKEITLEVWGERLRNNQQFQSYQKNYPTGRTAQGSLKSGYVLFSVATTSDSRLSGKVYRRAYAYVLDDDATVHFMTSPSSGD